MLAIVFCIGIEAGGPLVRMHLRASRLFVLFDRIVDVSLLLKLGLLCVCVGFCLLFLVLIVWGVMWLQIVSFFFGRSLDTGEWRTRASADAKPGDLSTISRFSLQ